MDKNFPVPDFLKFNVKLQGDIRRLAAVHCLNFFKESFYKKGFTDTSFVPWEKRNEPDYRKGGALLVATSNLLESLQTMRGSNQYQIIFGTYAQYAKIHNEGGTLTIPITVKSRKFFWYMFKKTGDDKWKAMALTKKTVMKVKMPKRQFIGESEVLMNELDKLFIAQIINQFKNLK